MYHGNLDLVILGLLKKVTLRVEWLLYFSLDAVQEGQYFHQLPDSYSRKSKIKGQYSISKSFPFFHPHYHTHSGNTSWPVNLAVVRWLVSYEEENEYGNDNGNEIED